MALIIYLLLKVLKKRLSMNEPSIMAGNFAYEEGMDLEPDEVAANAKFLPVALDKLPGGGLKHGTIVDVSDQAQDFSCQLVLSHKVGHNVNQAGACITVGSNHQKSS